MERQNSMTRHFFCTMAILAMTSAPIHAAPQPQHHTATPPTQTRTKETPIKKEATHPEEGERIFQQQCSRCHSAPESFSQRISGTIIRHMRVRASLSQSDEEKLLRFLNP
jgi:cytochrome c5